jgi:hypothetical protein
MSSQVVALNPNLPVPPTMTLSDPSHPLNLLKRGNEIQQQAAMDAQYDVAPPKRRRVEAFTAPKSLDLPLLAFLALLFVAIYFGVAVELRPLYFFVLSMSIVFLYVVKMKTL